MAATPTDSIIANYRNLHKQDTSFVGGFTTFAGASRDRNDGEDCPRQIGAAYKEYMTEPGPWAVYAYLQGETIPKEKNHVRLSPDKKDDWGIPQLITSVDYDDNDEKLLKDFFEQTSEMFDKAGIKDIETEDTGQAPGLDIHEMGGCRMGNDAKTSMLNKWNQLHALPKCFCNGWCLHDQHWKSKPFYFIYGFNSKGGGLCSRGDEEKKFMMFGRDVQSDLAGTIKTHQTAQAFRWYWS
jgi:hypothetical protein